MKKSVLDSYFDNRLYRLNTLKIKIQETCNLRCRMCNHWQLDQKMEQLSTQKILDIVDEASSLGCRQVTFTGGEPTLRKDLEEIFARVKKHNMRISLLTNGFAISSQRLNALVANGLNKISVSIDSPEAEIHDDIRGVKGAFQRSIEFLRNCVIQRHAATDLREVMIATCLLRTNLYKLPEMVKLVKELGADTLTIIRIDQHNSEGASLDLTDEEKILYQTQIIPNLKSMCLDNRIKFRTSGITENFGLCAETELKDLPCYFVWANATVATNGDLYPCCDLIRSPGSSLGNVNQMTLKEIFDSDRAANIRSLMNERVLPGCRQCYWEDDFNRRIHKMCLKKEEYAGANGE